MPPKVRGDWYYTPTGVRHCCRMHLAPGLGPPIGNVPPGTYLGPVHDVEWNGEYFAICVPYVRSAYFQKYWPSDAPSLVWISTYCARNRSDDWSGNWSRPVHFAKKVPPRETKGWTDQGWVNQFLDDCAPAREMQSEESSNAKRRKIPRIV